VVKTEYRSVGIRRRKRRRMRRWKGEQIETVRKYNCAVIIGSMSAPKNEAPNEEKKNRKFY
jgi:hypothetical protein